MRATITNKIRNIGNDIYNRQVVEENGSGNYLPVKRSNHLRHQVTNLTHVVCKHCSGLFKKTSLHKHIYNCKEFTSKDGSKEIQESEGQPKRKKMCMLPNHSTCMVKKNEGATDMLKTEVFPNMQRDEETLIAQGDRIIAKYGSNLRFTHRTAKQVNYCSSKMRTLAKLYINMKQKNPELREFQDCLKPEHFDTLMESVRKMSDFQSNGIMKAPSVPPRLCSALKKCASIVKSNTIKDKSLTQEQKKEVTASIDDFLFLMDKDWATEVGTNSEKSRKKLKVTKKDLLPDPEDIRKMSKYINDMCPLLIERLKQLPTVNNYETLAKLIIVHIIILNRRRPNETVEITLETYQSTLNKRVSYGQELQSILSEEQMNAAHDLSIFYISANKNLKKVPTLLTKVFQQAVDELIVAREKIGIKSKYLFGRLGSQELFDGTVVLREIVNKANLKSPSTFTANSLRHHAATSSQLHSRNDTFTKRLSQFMGHDLKTHENYYQMPLPLVDKYLVGPRLLQMTLPAPPTPLETATSSTALINKDKGRKYERCETVTSNALTNQYLAETPLAEASETLTDAVRQAETPLAQDSETLTDAGDQSTDVPKTTRQTAESLSAISETNHYETPIPRSTSMGMAGVSLDLSSLGNENSSEETQTPSNNESQNDPDFIPDCANDCAPHVSSDEDCEIPTKQTPGRKVFPKVRWSTEEKTVIYERFGRHFMLKISPTRQEVKKVWENEPILQKRTLKQVVTYINNITKNKQSISTPIRNKIKNMVSNDREKFSP
jgi:hypothetical protein